MRGCAAGATPSLSFRRSKNWKIVKPKPTSVMAIRIHAIIVIGPGVIVRSDPLVVYPPETWLQSALPENVPSVLNVIV